MRKKGQKKKEERKPDMKERLCIKNQASKENQEKSEGTDWFIALTFTWHGYAANGYVLVLNRIQISRYN